VWAADGANSAGRPLTARPPGRRQAVVDVPAKLAARVRLLDRHDRKTGLPKIMSTEPPNMPSDLRKRSVIVIGSCYYTAGLAVSWVGQGEVEELRWLGQVQAAQDGLLAGEWWPSVGRPARARWRG